jgi:hypothetical protein
MISRPDMGNNRTVDSIAVTYVKEMKKGKPNLMATVSLVEASNYFRMAFNEASAGAGK